jgi:hypothetical protein
MLNITKKKIIFIVCEKLKIKGLKLTIRQKLSFFLTIDSILF